MIGRRPHAQRRRRWFAATACVLWLLGVEVLPNLHLAFHADDHSHGADGTIVHDHDHGAAHHHDGAGEHDAVARGDRDDHAGSTLDHAPSTHTAAGIAHHAIALHRPPPPLLEPLPVLRAAWRLEHEPARPLHDLSRALPNARGPPATI
jgi:hypothetical protein